MTPVSFFVALTIFGVAVLLRAEAWEFRPGVWIAKPLASTAFVAAAVANGALGSAYGIAVGVALALSWLGDVLLIPKGRPGIFRAGIASFLLGHVAFVAAFFVRGVAPGAALGALAASAVPAFAFLRWISPRLPAGFRVPVFAYVGVISAMVAAAAGTVAAAGDLRILAGALAFYVSDLSVARDRFVAKGFVNKVWGLPLYYGAQILFALTVGG